MKKWIFFCVALASFSTIQAQDTLDIRTYINDLASKKFSGRGYEAQGMQKAGAYIADKFKSFGIQAFNGQYEQPFDYSINTFPSAVNIFFGDNQLIPGSQFLIVPNSNSIEVENVKLKITDALDIISKIDSAKGKTPEIVWQKALKDLSKNKYAHYIEHSDTLLKVMHWKNSKELAAHLPAGLFFIAKKGKPIWPTSQAEVAATLVEVWDSTFTFKKNEKITASIQNKWQSKFKTQNIIGFVKGTTIPDSYIVFSAHYDHLGKMGNKTVFPGASDNASGTAMLLQLAQYYAQNPAKYSIAFIAFAGEEAGLLGSKFYVEHPVFPLKNIKFLVNIDIMGDATEGLSIVNGVSETNISNTFIAENTKLPKPLADIRLGENSANSDHYSFTDKGVPAVFIFSRGGKGWYHDIWDQPDQLSLQNIPTVYELIKQVIASY